MKPLLLAAFFAVIAAPAFGQAAPPPPVLYASAADVEQAMAKAKAEHKGDDTNTVRLAETLRSQLGEAPAQWLPTFMARYREVRD